jgi:hypothetical protein
VKQICWQRESTSVAEDHRAGIGKDWLIAVLGWGGRQTKEIRGEEWWTRGERWGAAVKARVESGKREGGGWGKKGASQSQTRARLYISGMWRCEGNRDAWTMYALSEKCFCAFSRPVCVINVVMFLFLLALLCTRLPACPRLHCSTVASVDPNTRALASPCLYYYLARIIVSTNHENQSTSINDREPEPWSLGNERGNGGGWVLRSTCDRDRLGSAELPVSKSLSTATGLGKTLAKHHLGVSTQMCSYTAIFSASCN